MSFILTDLTAEEREIFEAAERKFEEAQEEFNKVFAKYERIADARRNEKMRNMIVHRERVAKKCAERS